MRRSVRARRSAWPSRGCRRSPSCTTGAVPCDRETATRIHLRDRPVYFKEVYGVDPLASYLTVYTTGQAVAVIIGGGTDGASVRRFQLAAAELRKLRRLVRHTRLRNTTCCNNLNGRIFWVTTPARPASSKRAFLDPRARWSTC